MYKTNFGKRKRITLLANTDQQSPSFKGTVVITKINTFWQYLKLTITLLFIKDFTLKINVKLDLISHTVLCCWLVLSLCFKVSNFSISDEIFHRFVPDGELGCCCPPNGFFSIQSNCQVATGKRINHIEVNKQKHFSTWAVRQIIVLWTIVLSTSAKLNYLLINMSLESKFKF